MPRPAVPCAQRAFFMVRPDPGTAPPFSAIGSCAVRSCCRGRLCKPAGRAVDVLTLGCTAVGNDGRTCGDREKTCRGFLYEAADPSTQNSYGSFRAFFCRPLMACLHRTLPDRSRAGSSRRGFLSVRSCSCTRCSRPGRRCRRPCRTIPLRTRHFFPRRCRWRTSRPG